MNASHHRHARLVSSTLRGVARQGMTSDARVRSMAFTFLDSQRERLGDVLPWPVLQRGFDVDGTRTPLVGLQGIFKPKLAALPLTIMTVPEVAGRERPYEDGVGPDGLIRYKYRGTDPQHHENVGLRELMRLRIPLIYLYGVVKGQYLPVYPVLIVGDDPRRLEFTVDVDAARLPTFIAGEVAHEATIERRYAISLVRRRMHQQAFRARVLEAYREQCAMCRLRHAELLDAAHIVPDAESGGVAAVRNGLSLCTLHHAAFDRLVIGVRPDLVIEVRADVLEEVDGPMLKHGLQGLHGKRLHVPRSQHLRPGHELLEERYARFRKVS